jgi:hypothetical protein
MNHKCFDTGVKYPVQSAELLIKYPVQSAELLIKYPVQSAELLIKYPVQSAELLIKLQYLILFVRTLIKENRPNQKETIPTGLHKNGHNWLMHGQCYLEIEPSIL